MAVEVCAIAHALQGRCRTGRTEKCSFRGCAKPDNWRHGEYLRIDAGAPWFGPTSSSATPRPSGAGGVRQGKRKGGVMNGEELMERHKPELLAILRDASPAVQGNRQVAAFLGRVLDDEEAVDLMPPRRPPLPGEEAFWWCIEQLLLLCDIARPANDPYLLMVLEDLKSFAERVECRQPLPPGYRLDWLGE